MIDGVVRVLQDAASLACPSYRSPGYRPFVSAPMTCGSSICARFRMGAHRVLQPSLDSYEAADDTRTRPGRTRQRMI